MENRLTILSESLDRKIQILEQIQKFNELQAEAFSRDNADLEEFDRGFEEKDKLINEMIRLDDGFDALYEEIAKELKDNRLKYAAQIKRLQQKIEKVTELSVSIQTQEQRNKKLAEDYFTRARNGIRQNRQTSRAAYDYYRNMSGTAYSTSRIMDNKQ